MYNHYTYKGVTAWEMPNGMIQVQSRSGNYVALTPSVAYAVTKFVAAVKETTVSEQDGR